MEMQKPSHTQSKTMKGNNRRAPKQLDLEEFIQQMPSEALTQTTLQPAHA